MQTSDYKRIIYIFFLISIPIILILLSLIIGSYKIDPITICRIVIAKISGREFENSLMSNLFWQIRLPRVITAALVGAGLSVSGAVFQSLFKNPLASPYTLGVSNGAGFGAALGIVLSLGTIGIQVSSALFGLISISITFLLSMRSKNSSVTLVLAGMLVSALFSSLIAFIKLVADPFEKLPQIVFWLMGSLSGSSITKMLYIIPLYLISLLVIILFRWKINVMSMGDSTAKSFGVDVNKARTIVVVAASILTAVIVSVSGIVSWVGIVVPHLARMIVGPDIRKIIPVSISIGICYLLIIDDICRTITSSEIPIGVVTGIVGAPVFMFFILKRKVDW